MNNLLIDELIKALWTEDAKNAIVSIKAIGDAALPDLFAALKKDDRNAEMDWTENGALRQAIIGIGEPAFRKLIKALAPGSDMVRAAAKTLRLWGDKRAVEPMIIAMRNDAIDLNGRCYVIQTLGYFKDPKAFEPLKLALMDENEYIRCFAARALSEYGDISVIPSIFNALRNVKRSWWYGTTESIGEITKVFHRKCAEKGLEAEFIACLKQMETLHPEMVAEYRSLNEIELRAHEKSARQTIEQKQKRLPAYLPKISILSEPIHPSSIPHALERVSGTDHPKTNKILSNLDELKKKIIAHKRPADMFHLAARDLSTFETHSIPELLDLFVAQLGFDGIDTGWEEIDFPNAVRIIFRIIQRDLAYDINRMSVEEASALTEEIVNALECNPSTRFFTNGDYYLEKSRGTPGNYWHAITTATFDTGVVVLNERRIGLVWAEGED